jgi:haloacetate dehalogenase
MGETGLLPNTSVEPTAYSGAKRGLSSRLYWLDAPCYHHRRRLTSPVRQLSLVALLKHSIMTSMFDGFTRQHIETHETTINLVRGGRGSPILLLHGYPQPHVCWHRLAPILAERFTVVCPDLRGYGDSAQPPSDAEPLAYSKRVMAQDQVAVMRSPGFSAFAVVGHDRGARVAHRMALDSAENITKLALLDSIPTSTAFANVNQELAPAAFHWFFSIQPDGLPERLIGAEPAFYLRWCLDHWCGTQGALAVEAVAEYQRCFDAAAIRATCEEFRAAATIDLLHAEADQAQKISCPTLLVWSATSMWATWDMLEIWRSRAEDVQGVALACGHFLAEEDPERTAAELIRFLS